MSAFKMPPWSTWKAYRGTFVLAALVFLVFGALIGATTKGGTVQAAPAPSYLDSMLSNCIAHNIGILKKSDLDIPLLKSVSNLCYTQLHDQGLLNDFQIRRVKFAQQHYAEGVILWMVVAITLSGVFLAALQLYATYRLAEAGRAEFGKDGELSIERDRIALKSSVTGLFILAVSFAFFSVFVYEIYTIKEVNVDGRADHGAQTFQYGGLGPPPAQQANPAGQGAGAGSK